MNFNFLSLSFLICKMAIINSIYFIGLNEMLLVKCCAQCLAHEGLVNVSDHSCNQQCYYCKIGMHLLMMNFILLTQTLEHLPCSGQALCFACGRVQEKEDIVCDFLYLTVY